MSQGRDQTGGPEDNHPEQQQPQQTPHTPRQHLPGRHGAYVPPHLRGISNVANTRQTPSSIRRTAPSPPAPDLVETTPQDTPRKTDDNSLQWVKERAEKQAQEALAPPRPPPLSTRRSRPGPVEEQYGVEQPRASLKPGLIISTALHKHDFVKNHRQVGRSQTLTYIGDWVHSKRRPFIIVERYKYHFVAIPLYTNEGHGLLNKSNIEEYIGVRDKIDPNPAPSEGGEDNIFAARVADPQKGAQASGIVPTVEESQQQAQIPPPIQIDPQTSEQGGNIVEGGAHTENPSAEGLVPKQPAIEVQKFCSTCRGNFTHPISFDLNTFCKVEGFVATPDDLERLLVAYHKGAPKPKTVEQPNVAKVPQVRAWGIIQAQTPVQAQQTVQPQRPVQTQRPVQSPKPVQIKQPETEKAEARPPVVDSEGFTQTKSRRTQRAEMRRGQGTKK